ncbi:hypothetical protein [Solibacillus sp. NPDC093137]|uniref:hypothetical protein n=1 Tax=Solibacillus sp. NPDC093137 TaxID=3390678 RepID=UPI003CFFF7DB
MERILANINAIMYMLYLVVFIVLAKYLILDTNNETSFGLFPIIIFAIIFVAIQILLLFTAHNYFTVYLNKFQKENIKISFWAMSVYMIKEFFAVFNAFLITVSFMAYDPFDNFLIYIGISLVSGLILLIIFYQIEQCWFEGIKKFRAAIDGKINVANIVNILTGICTLFVFIGQSTGMDDVLIFTILSVVYIYYIYYNFIYIKIVSVVK